MDNFAKESETHSAEETEEDNVGDEDWLPAWQIEEESVEVVDSEEVNVSKEEEDEMEQGETEDDSMPASADSDTRICEGDFSSQESSLVEILLLKCTVC